MKQTKTKMDLTNFVLIGHTRKEAYQAHIKFEMGFTNPEVRVIIDFAEFCSELDKGYGNSDYIQIARLYEAPNGDIWYDNEYCV